MPSYNELATVQRSLISWPTSRNEGGRQRLPTVAPAATQCLADRCRGTERRERRRPIRLWRTQIDQMVLPDIAVPSCTRTQTNGRR
jgi:hypothetical protein